MADKTGIDFVKLMSESESSYGHLTGLDRESNSCPIQHQLHHPVLHALAEPDIDVVVAQEHSDAARGGDGAAGLQVDEVFVGL